MGPKEHNLKIWPQYYARVKDGTKTFEVRINDRDFRMGDYVVLKEYDPEMGDYTHSRNLKFKVGYIYTLAQKTNDQPAKVVFSLLNQFLVMDKNES